MQITRNLCLIGEIKHNQLTGEKYYETERDKNKNQIYLRKNIFLTTGNEIYKGTNCVGISLDIVKSKIIPNEVNYIQFKLLNFPKDGECQYKRVTLQKFLINSATIQEKGYDQQRIIGQEWLKC